MRKNFLKYFFITLFFISAVITAQTKSTLIQNIGGKDFYIHKIEKGQSLYAISKLYDVKLDDIYANNPEAKEGTKAGQEIKIPAPQTAKAVVTGTATVKNPTVAAVQPITLDTNLFYTHRVGKKETFYFLTKKYGVTEAEMKILNPFLITQGLKEGQLIAVGEKKRVIKSVPVNTVVSTHPDSANPNVIHHPKKSSYNISLMLPFSFAESANIDVGLLVKNQSPFPAVPALALDFYMGFKRAVDSLSSPDFSLTIDLHDVEPRDSAKMITLINDPKNKQSDMIFGPFHENGFKAIALKVKESGVPMISPVTQQNKILYNNVYVSKTNPSQFTLMESLADYIIDSLMINNANLIIAAPVGKDLKEEVYARAFKKYYNEKQKALGKTLKDTATFVKGLVGVKLAYKVDVKNVVVILSNNQVFISDFTTQLAIYADKKDITLCGWQAVSTTDNIDQEYLNQLNYTFPCQFNLTNTNSYLPLIANYREQLSARPGEYFYRGFDVAYYYLKNLKEIGPDFIYKLNQLPLETNYTRFKFVRPDNSTGFDNRGVYIFKYKDYQLYRTGWK